VLRTENVRDLADRIIEVFKVEQRK
jgi:hypothetical protein